LVRLSLTIQVLGTDAKRLHILGKVTRGGRPHRPADPRRTNEPGDALNAGRRPHARLPSPLRDPSPHYLPIMS